MMDSPEAERLETLQRIKGQLSRFSAERPMIVPQSLYDKLKDDPDLADWIDRIAPATPIPIDWDDLPNG